MMAKRKRKPKPPFYGAKVRCLDCHTVVQSAHRHDLALCRCYDDWGKGVKGIGIDGGGSYFRMMAGEKAKWEIVDGGNYEHEDE